MNKIIITILALLALTPVTYAGVVKFKPKDIVQKDFIAQVYVTPAEIKLYKVEDETNVCYISYQFVSTGSMGAIHHELSCLKK